MNLIQAERKHIMRQTENAVINNRGGFCYCWYILILAGRTIKEERSFTLGDFNAIINCCYIIFSAVG